VRGSGRSTGGAKATPARKVANARKGGTRKFSAAAMDQLVRQAASAPVELAFARCANRFSSSRWLDGTNQFASDAGKKLESMTDAQVTAAFDDFADFVAATTVLHCADGWTYLGRAMNAASAGSLATAKHLTYYAELRAAMAFLACHGIAVANRAHFALTSAYSCVRVSPEGTHKATWDLLRSWAKTPSAVATTASVIRVAGTDLASWIAAKPTANSLPAALPDLLQRWGLDLQEFGLDRARRNAASYEPTRLNPAAPSPGAAWIVEHIDQIWRLVEPGAAGSFPELDLILLRQTVESLHKGVHGARSMGRPAYAAELTRMIVGAAAGSMEDALLRRLDPATREADPAIIAAALRPTPNASDPTSVLAGMIGRALILLRLATGAVLQLRDRAGVAGPQLEFWAEEMGVSHGFWEPGSRPVSLDEMWIDVEVAVDDIRVGAAPTMAALVSTQGQPLTTAAGLDRVPVWSLSA